MPVMINLEAKRNFDAACQAVKAGEYERARELVKANPASDQRIIDRRIEAATNSNAKSRHD